MSDPQPATLELHCVCGERRIVPAGLRVVSCIKCGQQLGPPLPERAPRPAIFLLAAATYATQLASGVVLCVAIAWAARRLDPSPALLPWLIVSLLGLFAAGKAYRGSVGSLLAAAAVDGALVAMCLAARDRLAELLRVSGVVPYVTSDAPRLALALAGAAALASLLCLAALPQARRYASWQHRQIELAFRTRRL